MELNLDVLQKKLDEIYKEIADACNHLQAAKRELSILESAVFEAKLESEKPIF